VTRSFRISEDAFNALVEDAAKEKVSVNTLVNQLFLGYSEFDRFFRGVGMIKASPITIGRLLAAASDEEAAKIGSEDGSDIPETIMMAKEGQITLPGVIRYLDTMADYSGVFENNVVISGGRTTITLMHRFGMKGSLFLKGFVTALLKSVNVSPTIVMAEHSVTIELPSDGRAMSWAARDDTAP
jgi:hypothetical protein